MAPQTALLQISRDGEIFQKCHGDRVSRESACSLESGSMLLALHHISVLVSYLLSVVHCGAIRTVSKDLDIAYPSSRDYEYLEDYLR